MPAIDLTFGLNPEGCSKVSHSEYVKKLRESIQESYTLAIERSANIDQHNKQRFDKKVREPVLQAGDRVLVWNIGIPGKNKIADCWSETTYTVVKQIKNSPVYVAVLEHSEVPERVFHLDLLLPCGFLSSSDEELHQRRPSRKPDSSQHTPAAEVNNNTDQAQIPEGDYEVEYLFPHSGFLDNTGVIEIENGRTYKAE